MNTRGEFAHLDDYELAVRSVEVAAEHARVEAHELCAHGFAPVEVAGLASVVWERGGRLHTSEAALSLIWSMPESKEDSP